MKSTLLKHLRKGHRQQEGKRVTVICDFNKTEPVTSESISNPAVIHESTV